MNKNKKRKGFTLIEMIVVIAILAILSIALIPLIANLIDKSRVSRFLADSDLMRTACLSFQADVGSLDQTIFQAGNGDIKDSSLMQNVSPSGVLGKWDGPYLEQGVDTHPWGGLYDLEYNDIDAFVPATGSGVFKAQDLTLQATNVDDEGETTPVPNALEVASELNKSVTGDTDGGVNVRAIVIGGNNNEVALVVLANVSN